MTQLTPKQRECLELIATGIPYKTVADRLGISIEVVKNRANVICRKLSARNSINAVYIATKAGILQ